MPSIVVAGSTGPTDFTTDLEDLVYSYLISKWTLSDPPTSKFRTQNRDYDDRATYHMNVTRGGSLSRTQETNNYYYYREPLAVHLYMKRLDKGKIAPQLGKMQREIERITAVFPQHDIDGVLYLDLTEISEPFMSPSTGSGQTTWRVRITVNVIYYKVALP